MHSYFGPGFPEVIHQRVLLIELQKAGLKCESELKMDVFYEGTLVGKRRLDAIVEDKVPVELKALSELDAASCNKIRNYRRVFSMEVGLLLNFGTEQLQHKGFVN